MQNPRPVASVLAFAFVLGLAAASTAQVTASLQANVAPPWNKGVQPISQESYWQAVECGKQGGATPPCVFWDNGLCKNEDFVITMYTPYKMVAYTVWQAVSQKKAPPTPSYAEAQRMRVILGITPAPGTKNTIAGVSVKRAGKVVEPATKSVDGSRGSFFFDFAAFAPTAPITIVMAGKTRTITCGVDAANLARFR